VELKDSQYQAGMKFINSAIEALNQVSGAMRRKEESSQIRRRLDEVEGILKKIKREMRLG
jgi:hypothetical protein